MKRHPALIAFSREHHQALSLARRIRLHPEHDYQQAIASLHDALLLHFDEEERLLSPWWAQLQRTDWQQRFDDEHATLRRLLQPPFQAALLADVLTAHVRFEERILFAALQVLLPDSESFHTRPAP